MPYPLPAILVSQTVRQPNSRCESRAAEDLFEQSGGGGVGGIGGISSYTGMFGETSHTPGGSPRFFSEGRRDSRRAILLKLTYLNLFLALVLITVGAAGPQYPGHSGTTDNPISNWVRISRYCRTKIDGPCTRGKKHPSGPLSPVPIAANPSLKLPFSRSDPSHTAVSFS